MKSSVALLSKIFIIGLHEIICYSQLSELFFLNELNPKALEMLRLPFIRPLIT